MNVLTSRRWPSCQIYLDWICTKRKEWILILALILILHYFIQYKTFLFHCFKPEICQEWTEVYRAKFTWIVWNLLINELIENPLGRSSAGKPVVDLSFPSPSPAGEVHSCALTHRRYIYYINLWYSRPSLSVAPLTLAQKFFLRKMSMDPSPLNTCVVRYQYILTEIFNLAYF